MMSRDATDGFLQLKEKKRWKFVLVKTPNLRNDGEGELSTDFLLDATEELHHGDVGRGFGHSQHHADGLQLLEHRAAGLLAFLLRLVDQDHPGRLQLRHQEGCREAEWESSIRGVKSNTQ